MINKPRSVGLKQHVLWVEFHSVYNFRRTYAKTFPDTISLYIALANFAVFSLNFKIQYPRFGPTFQSIPQTAEAQNSCCTLWFEHHTLTNNDFLSMEMSLNELRF